MTRPTKAKAMERLQKKLDAIPELRQLRYDSPKFEKWKRDTRIAISNTFDNKSGHIFEFNNIKFSLRGLLPGVPGSAVQTTYMQGLESAASLLESMIEEVEDYWDDKDQGQIPSSAQANGRPSSNQVFVIHGRDEGAKQTVARFLETLGLEPVILHEQANQGHTIIEKFEDHADVGFAVALLTPDDVGSLKEEKINLNPRARQNVIFEFGYFIGKLDRKRVCALIKGDVEKPSDYDGVLCIPWDDPDGWKMRLIKELKSAGFQLDANRAFQA